MIELHEQFTISAPPGAVWPLLSDPHRVADCLPGASLTADQGNGTYQGSMTVKFGVTTVVFSGELTLVYDHAGRCCTIVGKGIDKRGATRALANGSVRVEGDSTTRVHVDGAYNITGPLATFAKSGGLHVARALMAEFSANVARLLTQGGPATDQMEAAAMPAAPAAPPPPRTLLGGTLLWHAFLQWLRSLLGRDRR